MHGYCALCEKDSTGRNIWICNNCLNIVEQQIKLVQWSPVSLANPPHGVPVWLWSKEWIDEDFNPTGVREGHYIEDLGYISCGWDPCQDCFTTIENSKPEKWTFKIQPE